VYAVKEMNKRMLKSKSSVHTVIRELACSLAAPLSPFVCGFEFAFCTDASIFMGMPFMEHGDLERWLLAQPTKRFDEATARFYTAQIVLGLKQLHQAGVIRIIDFLLKEHYLPRKKVRMESTLSVRRLSVTGSVLNGLVL
jgi:serine/threonine-protein kinase greatwall